MAMELRQYQPNQYEQDPYMYQPGEPTQAPNPYGQYWDELNKMKDVTAPNYLDEFNTGYNDLMNKLYGMANDSSSKFDLGGDVGTGLYGSDLLNQLAGRVSSNLTNPDASIAMGLSRDRIQRQGIGARQNLSDSLAGLGSRGQGAVQAQMAQLNSTLNQQGSDAYRQIGMDTERNAITDAQALEGMRGGFYENQQARTLENARLRELAYNQMMSSRGSIANSMAGLLPSLADMLKNQGNLDVNADDKTRGNYQNLNEADKEHILKQYENSEKYKQEMEKYKQEMEKWKYKYNLPADKFDFNKQQKIPPMFNFNPQRPGGGGGRQF